MDEFERYVPRIARQGLGASPIGTAGTGTRNCYTTTAAVLVIDVSGYTALTQRAVSAGADAIERFSASISDFFARLIEHIAGEDGDVVGFAGDAILAVFDHGEASIRDATLAAARCALACRGELLDTARVFTTAPGAGVPSHMTLSCGSVWTAVFGRAGRRRHALVGGRALNDVRMSTVPRGTVALSAAAMEVIGDAVRVSNLANGTSCLEGIVDAHATPTTRTRPRLVEPLADADALSFLPLALAERLQSGLGAWLAEMRFVSPVFVSLEACSGDEPAEIDATTDAILTFEDELLALGGELLHVRVEEQGITAIGAYGTPGCTWENNASRAIRTAHAVLDRLAARGRAADIGVSSGAALCAVFGARTRCDFGILGDVMNTAARLMQQGEGVLCDRATAQRAGLGTAAGSAVTMRLKGLAAPVDVVRLDRRGPFGEATVLRHHAPPDVTYGRDPERLRIDHWLAALSAGRLSGDARTLLVEGEAGMGKSTLVGYLLRAAAQRSVDTIVAWGSSTESLTPYFVWRTVLQRLCAPADGDPASMSHAIEAALAGDPALATFTPLLNDILPLGLPDNDITRQMEPSARAATTARLLLHLLAHTTGPRLVVFEDAQWIDSASWAVIVQAAQLPSVLALALTTRLDEAPRGEAEDFVVRVRGHGLRLQGLSETAVGDIVSRRLGASTTAPDVARFLCERSAGNPLFVEELALALQDRGELTIEANACIARVGIDHFARLELPMTVRSVILERVDGLSARQQLLIKVASVIGASAPIEMISAVSPVPIGRDELDDDLRAIEAKSLAARAAGDAGRVLTFRHAVTREAAYGLLTPSQRRSLHAAVGEWHERSTDDPDSIAPLLAHHFRCADDRPRALRYLERAGEQAYLAHANGEAVQFLSASLTFEGDTRAPHLQQARRRRLLAEAHLKLSGLAACREQLLDALRLLDEPVRTGRTAMLLDVVRFLFGAARESTPAHLAAPAVTTTLLAAQLHQLRAEVAYFEHDTVALLHGTLACLRQSRSTGPSRERAASHGTAGIVLGLLRLERAARRHVDAARETAERSGHAPTVAYVHQLACVYHSAVGDWNAAERAIELAAAGYQRVGEVYRWQSTRMILAYQALHRGSFSQIAHYLREADERNVFPSGPRQVRTWFRTVELAGYNAAAVRGLGPPPTPQLVHEVELLADLADPSQALLCHGFAADALCLQGQWTAARRHADLGLQVLRAQMPTTYYSMFGIASIAGSLLTLGERDSAAWRSLRPSAVAAIQRLRAFALMVPIALPSASLLQARLRLLDGRRIEGERALTRAIEQASRCGTGGVEAAARRFLDRVRDSVPGHHATTQTGWA